MLSDEQKDQLSAEIIPLFQDLEQEVIQDIARRLRKEKRWTESAELQAKALEKLGHSPAETKWLVLKELHADKEFEAMLVKNTLEHKKTVREEINRVISEAKKRGDDIVSRAGLMSFADDVSFWESQGRHLQESPVLRQIGKEVSKRLEHDLKSLTHSTGFKFVGAPIKEERAFNYAMNKAITNVTSGAFSSQQAVEEVVADLEKSGLRKVDFASGISRAIDVAAHLAVRTTLGQMAADISMRNAKELDTDLVEVSSHAGARDGDGHANHAAWQGKVYSISGKAYPAESKRLGYRILKLSDATGYPDDPLGLCGFNCRHTFYPFFEGVSEPNPIEQDPEPVEVDGKIYTYYQAIQKQRRIERELREYKRQHIGGQNRIAAITAKEQQYARFCEKAGLKQNLNRLYVKGYKRDFAYIKVEDKSYREFKEIISKYYRDNVLEVTGRERFVLGRLPISNKSSLLDGSNVHIEGQSIKRIMDKHGNEMTHSEFMLIRDAIESPDYFADNGERHKNSLILYKKIPDREKRYVECIFIKREDSFVIHYHKMTDRKLKKLAKTNKLVDFRYH